MSVSRLSPGWFVVGIAIATCPDRDAQTGGLQASIGVHRSVTFIKPSGVRRLSNFCAAGITGDAFLANEILAMTGGIPGEIDLPTTSDNVSYVRLGLSKALGNDDFPDRNRIVGIIAPLPQISA